MQIFPTKRFWKRLVIGAAILIAIALIANGFMARLTEHRLQTRIAAIRAAGDPAAIADLAPKPIPDDQNAAFYLEQIRPQLKAFDQENGRFYNKTEFGKAFGHAEERGDQFTPQQIDAIRAIIDKYPEIDTSLAAAANCRQYASRLDFSLDYQTFLSDLVADAWPIRAAFFFTAWRMNVFVADHKQEEAVDRGIRFLRLVRLRDTEPGLVSFLVGVGMRSNDSFALYNALAAGPIPPEIHSALDHELVMQEDPQRLVRALVSERPLGFGSIESVAKQGNWLPIANVVGWPIKSYYLGWMDYIESQLQVAGRPWYEIRDQFGPRDAKTGLWGSYVPNSGYGVMADLVLPSLRACYQANAHDLSMLRSLRMFNALRQYAEQNGREARGLEDLSLPKAATIDPFSGEPLKLKRTDDGWIIYSVGDNGVDDGGDLAYGKDIGLAPQRYIYNAYEKADKASKERASEANQ